MPNKKVAVGLSSMAIILTIASNLTIVPTIGIVGAILLLLWGEFKNGRK